MNVLIVEGNNSSLVQDGFAAMPIWPAWFSQRWRT